MKYIINKRMKETLNALGKTAGIRYVIAIAIVITVHFIIILLKPVIDTCYHWYWADSGFNTMTMVQTPSKSDHGGTQEGPLKI